MPRITANCWDPVSQNAPGRRLAADRWRRRRVERASIVHYDCILDGHQAIVSCVFDERNLWYMRGFYLAFRIGELSH